jgi:hypothetical protein
MGRLAVWLSASQEGFFFMDLVNDVTILYIACIEEFVTYIFETMLFFS